MSDLEKKFVIGRYYFNSLFKKQAEDSFLDDLMKEPFVEEKNFEYAIGNLSNSEDEVPGIQLLRGTFGRMRKGTMGKTYDREKKEFQIENLPEIADIILEFIINHKNHLIFFEYSSIVTPQYFANKFKKIYSNTATISDFEIDFIFVEENVYEAIKHWQTLERIMFKRLRPSNPSSLDSFEDIERLLRETKSAKTDIVFHAPETKNESGNSVVSLDGDSQLIKQALALSAHGYGEAILSGKKDGKDVEVQTKRFLKKIEIDFSEDGALKKIVQTIEEIQKQEK